MEILAHRGLSAHYHENSLEAFDKALELNILGIECDLHQIENDLVVFHDFQLNRLLKRSGFLSDLSLNELSKMTLSNSQGVPRLSELLALVEGQCILNLEVKQLDDPALLIKQITPYLYQYENATIVLSSFNHPLLKRLQEAVRSTRFGSRIKFGALIAHLPTNLAQYAIDLEVDIAAISVEMITKEFVEHAHMYNLDVWSYTINTKKELFALLEMGVDAVFSNDPALMQNYLAERA